MTDNQRKKRKNPWHKCRDNAVESAKSGKQVYDCPYKGAWQTYWIKVFEKAKQLNFDF